MQEAMHLWWPHSQNLECIPKAYSQTEFREEQEKNKGKRREVTVGKVLLV
jgi:hypothetical protein